MGKLSVMKSKLIIRGALLVFRILLPCFSARGTLKYLYLEFFFAMYLFTYVREGSDLLKWDFEQKEHS